MNKTTVMMVRACVVVGVVWAAYCVYAWIDLSTSANVANPALGRLAAQRALIAGIIGSGVLFWIAFGLPGLRRAWVLGGRVFVIRLLILLSVPLSAVALGASTIKLIDVWSASSAYGQALAKIDLYRTVIIAVGVPAAATFGAWAFRWVAAHEQDADPGEDELAFAKGLRQLFGMLVLIGAIGLAGIGISQMVPTPDAISISKTPGQPAANPSPKPSVSTEMDLSSSLAFADLSNCSFVSEGENAFSRMLSYDDTAEDWKAKGSIRLAGKSFEAKISSVPANDLPGGRIITSSIDFPKETYWNGLAIARISVEHGDYPDIDDFDSRAIVFTDPASRLVSRMRGLGLNVPMEPDFLELGSDDVCGGAMQISSKKRGSQLVCSWSC